LFSATFPEEIERITRDYMREPLVLEVGRRNVAAAGVEHMACVVNAKDKYSALKRFLDSSPGIYTIIFCRTRRDTQELCNHLMKDGFPADALHGDLSQAQRDYTMQRFRLKQVRILIATDVAARGIDVTGLTHVFHYQLPDDPEVYTHRSGRTARAGKTGVSVAFAHQKERSKLRQIEKVMGNSFSYAKVPSGQEIIEKQVHGLIDRLEATEPGEYLSGEILESAAGRLAYLSPEELVAKVATLALSRIVKIYQDVPVIHTLEGEKSTKEHSDRTSRKTEFVALRINLGRGDGFFPKDLIELINDTEGGKNVNIGSIEIRNDETLFEVDKDGAQAVIDGILNSGRVDETVKVELTDEKVQRKDKKSGEKREGRSGRRSGNGSGRGSGRGGGRGSGRDSGRGRGRRGDF
jgi:ATP-dependent RNA helicase DeaD